MQHSGHCSANGSCKETTPYGLTQNEQAYLKATLQKITDLKFSIASLENVVIADLYDSYLRAKARDNEIRSFEKYLYLRLRRFEGDDD